jgi:threonine synthase
MAVTHLQCRACKAQYALKAKYVCERCFGPLEAAYDHDALSGDVAALRRRIQGGPQNIWRYADFLPTVSGPPGPSGRLASRVGLPTGCTPLVRADRLAQRLGLREVWVKNDTANPTHSFKDRVVSVAAARARELGYEVLACASTGNLANSVAAHAAALGLQSYVLIPASLEEQKILATGVYGTKLVAIDGDYDDVNRLCTEISAERDWAFVNINLRPYYAEGSKTLAYEIAEQLGFELPDRCVVPIASGSLYTKLAKGFEEWRALGLVSGSAPRMNGAQADGCAPVANAYAVPTPPPPHPPGLQAREGGHDREVACDRQPRRRPLRARPRAAERRLDRLRQRRGDKAGDRVARADDGHLHRDRRRRHDSGAEEARRARGHRS